MKKILVAFGTRPEIIKLAPVISKLKQEHVDVRVLHTGQHDQLAEEMLTHFEIKPDYDLKIMRDNQDLFALTTSLLKSVKKVFIGEKPDAVIVQGDTASAYACALAAFYLKIPVYHVEAGLRSHDLNNPFPEEMFRKQISVMASIHFVPTDLAKNHLVSEGYVAESIFLTGNTIIDALYTILNSENYKKLTRSDTDKKHKLALVTAHRRENHGKPLIRIMEALLLLLNDVKDLSIIFPAHPSPAVQSVVTDNQFFHDRLKIAPPLPYFDFLHLLEKVDLVLTDSGGLQEEAAALGKNLVVLRTNTERQELVENGFTKLVGTEIQSILEESKRLLNQEGVKKRTSVYGDGTAAQKIVEILKIQLKF